jgi:putative zinc finger/helix-turn-helix YgiT family protein
MSKTSFSIDLEGVGHDCGGTFHAAKQSRTVSLSGKPYSVEQDLFICSNCGEVRQTLTQLGNARRAAAAESRNALGLLAPDQIRSIRENRLHVTQSQLENALGLGAKTVVRWETGKVIQPKATDNLLRILDRDPSLLLFLAELHGVCLPAETLSFLPDASRSITIPKRYMDGIEAIASEQGVEPREYVAWVLAEEFSKEVHEGENSSDLKTSLKPASQRSKWNTGQYKVVTHTRRSDDLPDAIARFAKAFGGNASPYAKFA